MCLDHFAIRIRIRIQLFMLLKFFNLDFIFRDSHILAELQDMENTFTNMEQVDI